MGWYFSAGTREALIRELLESQNTERVRVQILAHTLCDDVLWSVVRITAKQAGVPNLSVGESTTYIRCDLLEVSGGQWGYKPLDESMHPYSYTCPLAYLKMAPVQCAEWRERVHSYHARLQAAETAA